MPGERLFLHEFTKKYYYYYSINQIEMCRISLNQIIRSESQENHF